MLAFSFTGFDELNKIYVEAELRIQNWTIILHDELNKIYVEAELRIQNWTIILLDCSEHTQ